MAASDRRECEFSLIRYIPDPVKSEFVNIGVMLRDLGTPGRNSPALYPGLGTGALP